MSGVATWWWWWSRVGATAGNVHWRNTMDQLKLVGPKSLGVALLTAGFVGMVFTIQVTRGGGTGGAHLPLTVSRYLCCEEKEGLCPGANGVHVAGWLAHFLRAGWCGPAQFVREFTKLGLTRSVGGVMALALSRELTPVVTAIILAGRVGSAFAAELGTMQARAPSPCARAACL